MILLLTQQHIKIVYLVNKDEVGLF
jgi:hypothetical protein